MLPPHGEETEICFFLRFKALKRTNLTKKTQKLSMIVEKRI